MQVRSISEVRSFWDAFSEDYAATLDAITNTFYYTLINMLELEKRSNVLEVGAGCGFLYDHTLARKAKNAHYTATDLSEKMLHVLCRRIGVSDSQGFSEGQSIENAALGLTIEMANGEELKYATNTFDCYIANLCLQATTNPDQMIAESFRVLSPGGVAGFSVWGDIDDSVFFTALPNTQQEMGVPLPQVRSNFHLNNRQGLIARFKAAGFTEILCWNQFTPTKYRNQAHIEELLAFSPFVRDINSCGEKADQVKYALIQKLKNSFEDKLTPVGINGLIIIGVKPIVP